MRAEKVTPNEFESNAKNGITRRPYMAPTLTRLNDPSIEVQGKMAYAMMEATPYANGPS